MVTHGQTSGTLAQARTFRSTRVRGGLVYTARFTVDATRDDVMELTGRNRSWRNDV